MNELFDSETKKIFYVELMVVVFLIALVVFLGLSRVSVNKQATTVEANNRVLQNKIQKKQIKLNKEASDKALSNSDHEVKISALQVNAEKNATSIVKKLFPILLNYSSGKEYAKRSDLSKPYVTNKVLKSKNIFATDMLGQSSISYIDEVGLHSKFKAVASAVGLVKNDHVPVIIIANYEAWFDGSRHGIAQDVYEGEFNIEKGKFDKLTKANNLFTGREKTTDDED